MKYKYRSKHTAAEYKGKLQSQNWNTLRRHAYRMAFTW